MYKKLLMIALMLSTLTVKAFSIDMDAKIIEPKCDSYTYENDTLAISIYPQSEYYASFSLTNKLDERLYIEWKNFRWNGSAIMFSDDSRYSMNVSKEDETVLAGETSSKSLIQKALIGDGFITPWYREKDFKKGGQSRNTMIVPIRFSNGKIKDMKIRFVIFNSEFPPVENPTEATDSVQVAK